MTARHYPLFSGNGRGKWRDAVGAVDPFALDPVEIAVRVLDAGFKPVLSEQWMHDSPPMERACCVEHGERLFMVAVQPADEAIEVQEIRCEAFRDIR